MAMRLGCSGWSYDHWREPVYEGAPPRTWLTRYAERFDTVEINSTFYRLPRRSAVALGVGDHPQRPFQTMERTADWSFVRFHYGHRGRRGNYSDRELESWARRIQGWARAGDVYAYFNNDWEAFAVKNAEQLRRRL